MGEYADMLLDGTCDYLTGEYIGDPCGYPRTMQGGRGKRPQYKKQRPQYSEARNAFIALVVVMDCTARNYAKWSVPFSSRKE